MTADSATSLDALFDVSLPDAPYPGLRPFEKNEWPVFFGRETITGDVIERLIDHQFVAAHGDSGCGKSSLVRAGVMPRLERDHARGGVTWRTCSMLPRNAPMRNLAEALAQLAGDGDGDTATEIRRILNLGAIAGPDLAQRIRRDDRDYVCVLIDQFEEIFAFADAGHSNEANQFIEVLTGLQRNPQPGIHVILTMRSEFLGACARFKSLAETINESQFLLPRMDKPALMRAVREPARLFGGRVERELAERIIADAGQGQDQLPLMQHAMMLLYQRKKMSGPSGRKGWILSAQDLAGTGGVARLLSDHADDVFGTIVRQAKTETARTELSAIVERAFKALTDINAEGHAVRRPQKISELMAVTGASYEDLMLVFEPMCADGVSFIKIYGTPPFGENELVDISHEALIRCWSRIADEQTGWLQQEFRDGLIWQSLLLQADNFADDRKQYLSPMVTRERERWIRDKNRNWAKRYQGTGRTVDGWERVQSLLQTSRTKSRIWGALALAAVVIIGVAVVALVVSRWQTAEQERLASELRAVLAQEQAQRERAESKEAAALKAQAEANRQRKIAEFAKDLAEKRTQELQATLKELSSSEQARKTADANYKVAQSTNLQLRSRLLSEKAVEANSGGDHGSALAYTLWPLKGDRDFPYIPQAEAAAYQALYGLRERLVINSDVPSRVPAAQAIYSHNGRTIATVSGNSILEFWDAKTGRPARDSIQIDGLMLAASYSANGSRILIRFRNWVSVAEAADGIIVSLIASKEQIASAAISPDGRRVIIGYPSSAARIWDADNRKVLFEFTGHKASVTAVAFSPDGSRVASGSVDGTVLIWDASTGKILSELEGHTNAVSSIDFSPDGSRVATSSFDRTVRVWELQGVIDSYIVLRGHKDRVRSARFSPDGRRVVTASNDGTARVWNASTGALGVTLAGHEDDVTSAEFSPNMRNIVTASIDGTTRVWATSPALKQVRGYTFAQDIRAAFAPDLQQQAVAPEIAKPLTGFAAVSADGSETVRVTSNGEKTLSSLWNWSSGTAAGPFDLPDGAIPRNAGVMGGKPVVIYSIYGEPAERKTGAAIGSTRVEFQTVNGQSPNSVALTPDAKRVALTFLEAGRIDVFELADGAATKLASLLLPSDKDRPWTVAFNQSGTQLAGLSATGKMFRHDIPGPSEATAAEFPVDVTQSAHPDGGIGDILDIRPLSDGRIHALTVTMVAPATRAPVASTVENENMVPEISIVDISRTDPKRLTLRLDRQLGPPNFATLGPDGERALLVHRTDGIRLISRQSGGILAQFSAPGKKLSSARLSGDSRNVVALTSDGVSIVWPVLPSTQALHEFAKTRAPRRLTRGQIEEILVPEYGIKKR